MMKRSFSDGHADWTSRLMRYGQPLAYTLLIVAAALTVWNLIASSADRTKVLAQNDIVLALEQLLSAARDIETGSRGFALIGDDKYLEPYNASLSELEKIEAKAKTAWIKSGRSEGELNPIIDLIDRKRGLAAKLVSSRQAAGPSGAQLAIGSGEGKQVMDAVRIDVAEAQDRAQTLATEVERANLRRSIVLTSVALLAASMAVGYLIWLAWHRRRQVQSKTDELEGLGDRFRTLADNIPQLAWMADADGKIYWYNKQWYDYTGLSPADMQNDGWRHVHAPEMLEGASQRYFDAISEGQTWQDTFPLRGRDGGYRWFLSMAQPIRNPKGTITRWFGTNTDVTEQREQGQELAAARDAAEDANRAKSQFLANMSHELRTPLSAVIGYSEMLEEEVEESGQQHLLDDLAKIKSNARHLLSLINDVLDISKIEANKMDVYAEVFDVTEMIEDVAATVGSLIEKKHNRFAFKTESDLGSMNSDIVKLRQVLINLLSNAAKFTENGMIELGVRRASLEGHDSVIFSVKDSGLGMSEDQVAKLFQRFTQADLSTTRRFGGTGLGLAITKAFVEMLGGSINVSSEPGRGSTFEISVPSSLPVQRDESEASTGRVEIGEETSNEDLVLVIDDDPATRELLTRFLTRDGFTVRTAEDGKSGLRLAETLKPRVILLDVTMPRMDGWSVLRKLKDDPHLAAIPVVMCTVIDEQTLGFSLGAADYVLKPVNWERLREVLTRVQKDTAQGDVLIIDDDEDTRKRVRTLLAKNGWTVTEAGNGQEGLRAVEERLPAVVLLDLNMPEMDGFTFLRKFRLTPDWSSIPVIVMTARDLSAEERAELRGGGARVLEKGSVQMQDLISQLRVFAPRRGTMPPRRAVAPLQ